MRNLPPFALAAVAAIALASPLSAAQKIGAVAQDFKLTDVNGKTVQLSQFRGKTVVLEWHNPGCPFVSKHYSSGNMQATQKAARDQGAIWLTINSGAKGKQGHMTGFDRPAEYPVDQLSARRQGAGRQGLWRESDAAYVYHR